MPLKLLFLDVIEVNSLSVDWVYKNLYFADAQQQTIDVCDYEGKYRYTLHSTGLIQPRGLLVEPLTGYV